LDAPVALSLAAFNGVTLSAGRYVYAGSARGPGGLRARIARHLRRGKPRHWHVDHLTEAATSLRAFPVAGGNECALVGKLLKSKRYRHPLPGFGSSDCRRCVSHLLESLIGENQCR
jgi:Uri superfamily endonuclease